MCDYVDLIIRTILTIFLYLMATYHTYDIGKKQNAKPLKDVLHDMVPDWSTQPKVRDYTLILFIFPIYLLSFGDRRALILEFWELFIQIVTFKSICIFFTFLPPSNYHCHVTQQLNHCYHQSISGHNSFVFLLYLLYSKYGLFPRTFYTFIPFLLYSFIILCTRAHYSLDILESFIIVWLLVN